MSTPKRIQQRRTKGWTKPEGAVSVARPGRWGNPYRVHNPVVGEYTVRGVISPGRLLGVHKTKREATEHAVYLFEINRAPALPVAELAGKDLMCFCPLDQPCHADVLLALANKEPF